jgi:endonuclease YncB( thermonuclease family)
MLRPRRMRSPLPPSIHLPRRWRRRWPALLAVILIASLAGYDRWTYRPGEVGDHARYDQKNARVIHVVDGDTLDVDIPDGRKRHTRIRLIGVDTPETGQASTERMHFGSEARNFAVESLSGQEVLLAMNPEESRDRYGRLLAYVYLARDGSLFNEMLIERGFAYADTRFSHPFRERFETAEELARLKRAGLWHEVRISDMPAWRQRIEKRRRTRAD